METTPHYVFDQWGKIENTDLVFLLDACANSLVDSFPYKCMSCLWSLIWSNRVWGSWYLITWFCNGLLGSYFFKLTLGNDCLQLCFWTIAFKNHPDSVILQKYQSCSKQTFKHNLAHMPSLNLTPTFSFEPRFCMFINNGYYTKKTLVVLGLYVLLMLWGFSP